jgi:hypothetical protein
MAWMRNSERLGLAAICVAIAFAAGWIGLKWYPFGIWFIYLGIAGAIPFLLLNGVHGDTEGVAGVVGGVLFVLVNAAVYYGIVIFVVKRIRKRKKAT